MVKKAQWKQIGVVGVDSGQILITDPCYIDSEWVDEQFTPGKSPKNAFSYNACCQKTLHTALQAGQLKYLAGHAGVGVVASSGLGDGCYPVYARYEELEGAGTRIVELRIDFMQHPLVNGKSYVEIEAATAKGAR